MILTEESRLRVICQPVSNLEEANEIILSLEKELKLSGDLGRPGIGLSAPQIGTDKQVAIVRLFDRILNKSFKINLVNAKIKTGYNKSIFEGEGCLSFPGKTVKTLRFQEIVVSDNLIEPYNFIATGLVAVCIQHELDHLQGILLPDVAVK